MRVNQLLAFYQILKVLEAYYNNHISKEKQISSEYLVPTVAT